MKKENKCFDLNSKQKKHYEKWKKLVKNLSSNNPDGTEQEAKKKTKDKPKNFEDYFNVSTVIKSVNNLEYQPYLGV